MFTPQALPDGRVTLHGTLITIHGIGCLLVGASGSGKSRLAAECFALGGKLVADDAVLLSTESGMLMGSARRETQGVIELRGVGLVRQHDATHRQIIHLAVQLLPIEQVERLPAPHSASLLGLDIPVMRLPQVPHTNGLFLIAAVRAMYEGRILPTDWKP